MRPLVKSTARDATVRRGNAVFKSDAQSRAPECLADMLVSAGTRLAALYCLQIDLIGRVRIKYDE